MAKKTTGSKKNGKYSFINELHGNLTSVAEVTRSGMIRIKRSDIKTIIEGAFQKGAVAAASGERIRFPVIGALVRKDVPPRKAGKGTNPFTGMEIQVKARSASKKPRWSFPKSLKETFANKRHW